MPNTSNASGSSGNIAPGTSAGHHNEAYDNELPTRPGTGVQVDLDPKYTSVQRITTKDGSKPSVPNRQNTSGQPGSSKGLPAYAKVDKSQGKSVKGIRTGSKPPTAQKPQLKSKASSAKDRGFSVTTAEQSKPPPPPYETIGETLESRRKSDSLPAYASVGKTPGHGDDAAFSNGSEDAAGKEPPYDLLNPETMTIENHSTQQSSAASPDDSAGGSSLYDIPAAPSNDQFTPLSTSQETRGLGELAYGVNDLPKKDLSPGEIEVQQNGHSMNSSTANMEVPGINHHYATLDNPNGDV